MAWDRPPAGVSSRVLAPGEVGHVLAGGYGSQGRTDKGVGAWESAGSQGRTDKGGGAWEMAGSWDLSENPVLLAGADGNAYETRPTTSLARDLAQAETEDSVTTSTSAAGSSRPRRHTNPDDRPLRLPAASNWGQGPSDAPSPNHRAERGSAAGNRLADRPVAGFSSSSWSPPMGAKQRTSTSSGGYAGAGRPSFSAARESERRHSMDGAGPVKSRGSGLGNGCPSSKSYAPVDVLTNMGFDEDLARVAIAAAGGDVDRAVRVMLEDAKAHDARRIGEWEFEGDKGWAPFDCETDQLLREAFARGDASCHIRGGGNRYLVDFDSLTQLNLSSKRTRRIRRRGGKASSSSTDPSMVGAGSSGSGPAVAHERARPLAPAAACSNAVSPPPGESVGGSAEVGTEAGPK